MSIKLYNKLQNTCLLVAGTCVLFMDSTKYHDVLFSGMLLAGIISVGAYLSRDRNGENGE